MATVAPSQPSRELRRWRLGRELRRRRALRSTTVQLFYLLAAVGLGLAVPEIGIGFTVSSDRVIEALVAVGIGIVTFIGIVYSLLFLVVQFGTTTFTPRLNLFRDAPIVWHAFGYFAGILVFSFTAALSIGGNEDQVTGLVPITLGLMLLAALALFRRLQTTAFLSIQLASTLSQVADRGRDIIDHLYPAAALAEHPAAGKLDLRAPVRDVRWPKRAAVLQVIDVPPLTRRAQRENVSIEFRTRPGETLPEGGVVAVIHGSDDAELDRAILDATRVGHERTFEQDPLLALRVLADIALRGLSPALNDPTTAVQALDAMDSLLRPLARRELDVGRISDHEGTLRVTVPMPVWEDFLAVALDELIPLTHGSVHVRDRARRLLEELTDLALPKRREALRSRLAQLASQAS
jgi:uncharacterized membrane protein